MTLLATMRVLAPVAEPFRFRVLPRTPLAPAHRVYYTQSGTAALAFALSSIARAAGAAGAPQRDVLLPAYVCPDVLSAILFAGLRPKLVDLAPDACFPSADEWSAAIDHNTLVVLTVGFLGLRDPFAAAASDSSAFPMQVEDCCQVHPAFVTHLLDRAYIYSFGRGKPVSLLHGGAAVLPERLGLIPPPQPTDQRFAGLLIRGLAYNALRAPTIYGWARKLPGLRLGTTQYKPLNAVRAMHAAMVKRLSTRVFDAESRLRTQQRMQSMLSKLAATRSIVDLWTRHGSGSEWLLRYPILLPDRFVRDRVLGVLEDGGLGASAFYASALPNVPEVPASTLLMRSTENAQRFADRLITLPVHAAVRDRDIDAIGVTLARIFECL